MPRGRPRKVHSEDEKLNESLKSPHSSWDFTDHPLFANGELDEERLSYWQRWCDPDGCLTLEIADEVGTQTEKRHGQGRITFRRKYRRTQLQKLWPDIHWEPTKCQQDCLYLRKPYQPTIIKYDGRHQGRRNVFAEQKEAVKGGANIRDCSELPGANYQSLRSAELLMVYHEPERIQATREVHIVASSQAPMPTNVYRLNDMRFWNGYDAHSDVYINQRVCKLTLPQLRMVMGPAPFRVGRGRQARYDHIYISGLDTDERKALDLDRVGRFQPIDLLCAR